MMFIRSRATCCRGWVQMFVYFLAIVAWLPLATYGCDMCGCHPTDSGDSAHGHDHGDHHHHDSSSSAESAPLARNVVSAGVGSNVVNRFVVIADTQGLGIMDQLIADVNTHNPNKLLIPGDLVGTGGNGSWDSWISKAQNFNGGLTNILMTPGNHDQPSGTDALWRSKFSQTPGGQPWLPDSQTVGGETGFDQMDYYVDSGSTRYVSITTDTQAFGAQSFAPSTRAWLSEVLQATEADAGVEDVFVFTHHPVTFDSTDPDLNGTQGDLWQSLVGDSSKVRSLFTGHWHLYQPSQPDPLNPGTWEVVLGTGGGGLEGRAVQNKHGFTVVDMYDDGKIEATFYSDSDDGANGFQFNDILDRFTIADPNPTPAGLVAYYSFNFGSGNLDTAPSALGKQNHGLFNGDASTVSGGIVGKALSLDGSGDFADGAALGDYNMAINGDLTLSIHANFDTLAAGSDENTLVAYGAATGHPPTESEAVNVAYSLRIRDDKHLEMFWEHNNGTNVVLASTAAANVDAGEWHHYVVSRDQSTGQLVFYVDGTQLGDPVAFSELPTGGGAGFLHIGSSLGAAGGFDGMVDELTIYNDVLLPGQVFVGPLPGDLDGNGVVDLNDFTANFLPNFGTTVGGPGDLATLAMGDLDFDGDVDLFDFDAFQGAYLDANPGAAALSLNPVPEPGSLVLLAAGGLLFATYRRGHWFRVRPMLAGVAMALLIVPVANAASVIRDYQFSGNLTDSLGGPDLVSGGGILRTNGYSFASGNGLSLSGWDPTNLGEDYSIEFYARFDVFGNGSYGKLVDFKDRGSDNGFYIRNVDGGDRPIFFPVNQNSPGPDAMTQGEFHHVVISRDEPGSDDVNVWLDGVQQWTIDDTTNEHAVANAANNILHFFVDDGGSEHPAGYVDFLRIYDDGVTQGEVDAMVAGLPQYGAAEIVVNKLTGNISINANNNPEPLEMRGYQLTSASGALSDTGWSSWDDTGLDGDTWYEANPSTTQLAELNLTSTGIIASSRSLGAGYGGGLGGAEDLFFEYLEPGSPTPIEIPVTYIDTTVFTVGDLNFDTQIDSADWVLFSAGLGKDFTGMTMAEAFSMGDMDDDFDNDYEDFLLFREAFETANGPGSLAALAAQVPEPSTVLVALTVLPFFRLGRDRLYCAQH